MSQNRKSPVIWVADKVVLQLKVETPQACKLVMLNKAGVIAVVDLFKQYHPEGVHRKDVRVKVVVQFPQSYHWPIEVQNLFVAVAGVHCICLLVASDGLGGPIQ